VAGGLERITFFHNVAVQTERSIPKVDEAGMQVARERLQRIIQDIPPGATVEVNVVCGRPSDNILKQIQTTSAEVLFLGMPTRNLLSEKLFGSTTMNLVERTSIPMMILRPQLVSTYTIEELGIRCRNLFSHLLVPYDGSHGLDEFIDILKSYFQKRTSGVQQRCWLVWVIDEDIRRELQGDHPIQDAEAKLHQAADALRQLDITVETFVREGDPLTEVLAVAEEYDISAIATCFSGVSGIMRWSAPTLTHEIIRNSWHPILYFPKAG
jgi:nucleotide-binding universal stress UspA family protein